MTINLNNGLISIRNPDRNYVRRPENMIMTNGNKIRIFFLGRKVKLQPRQAVVAIFRIIKLNQLSDSKQVCIKLSPTSQSSDEPHWTQWFQSSV